MAHTFQHFCVYLREFMPCYSSNCNWHTPTNQHNQSTKQTLRNNENKANFSLHDQASHLFLQNSIAFLVKLNSAFLMNQFLLHISFFSSFFLSLSRISHTYCYYLLECFQFSLWFEPNIKKRNPCTITI